MTNQHHPLLNVKIINYYYKILKKIRKKVKKPNEIYTEIFLN